MPGGEDAESISANGDVAMRRLPPTEARPWPAGISSRHRGGRVNSSVQKGRRWRPLFAAATVAAIVIAWIGVSIAWFPRVGGWHAQDLSLYRSTAQHVLNGQVPYRDFNLEYPPLALLPLTLPGLVVGRGGRHRRDLRSPFSSRTRSGVLCWVGASGSRHGGGSPGNARLRRLAGMCCLPSLVPRSFRGVLISFRRCCPHSRLC